MTLLVREFRAAAWQALFDTAGLADFDSLWEQVLTQVEEGNVRGHGWSNVCIIDVSGTQFYIKRQSNYFTRAPQSYFRKTALINVEFEKISLFRSLGIPTLDVAYYGLRRLGSETQAILITRSLEEYKSLKDILCVRISFKLRLRLFTDVGKAIAQMHGAGQLHANLSPKHIFIKQNNSEDFGIRFIDLESSRSHLGQRALKLRDLEKLNRTLRNVSRTDKLRILLAYAGKARVDKALRRDILTIHKRTALKKLN